MSREKKYYLLWKGQETGAFSETEVRRMLKYGKIGLVHKIRIDGHSRYHLVKDFDFSQEYTDANTHRNFANSAISEFLIFALSGLSFLSPYFCIPYFLLFLICFGSGNRKLLFISLVITIVLSLSGILFFEKFYPIVMT